ncbi:hypothetical protein CWI84_04340 [Idiomarina tyrosinivorans]|uniref:Uncharacterized protein n=1 Tax=Idiomarina tyrosinivorans TaxID=1445662 RepID=A0A432ZSF3_9GAMM|nr:BcsR/BcsP family cellulose biosynthesis protein [Idiomarina tyrosinivorans]RUO80819.1 hypothetical protein CWI84_04340 [Idiomarina tyrosinivorans]
MTEDKLHPPADDIRALREHAQEPNIQFIEIASSERVLAIRQQWPLVQYPLASLPLFQQAVVDDAKQQARG